MTLDGEDAAGLLKGPAAAICLATISVSLLMRDDAMARHGMRQVVQDLTAAT